MTDATICRAAPNKRKVVLYRNGSVYTAADPFATAMLVDGDTVAWVGSEQAASSIADSTMEIIDLRGSLVAPGFVDSHVHLTETGIALDSLQLGRSGPPGNCSTPSGRARETDRCWDMAGTNPPGRTLHCRPPTNSSGPPEAGTSSCPGRTSIRRLVSRSLAAAAGLAGLDGFSPAGHRDAGRAQCRPPGHPATSRCQPLRGYQRRALTEAAANGYVAAGRNGGAAHRRGG